MFGIPRVVRPKGGVELHICNVCTACIIRQVELPTQEQIGGVRIYLHNCFSTEISTAVRRFEVHDVRQPFFRSNTCTRLRRGVFADVDVM